MRANDGDAGTIMEAFKPGTGPPDTYWVIGGDQIASRAARRSRRRPTKPSRRAAAAFIRLLPHTSWA